MAFLSNTSFEDIKEWFDDWIVSKEPKFFYHGIHLLAKKWEKVVASKGQDFEFDVLWNKYELCGKKQRELIQASNTLERNIFLYISFHFYVYNFNIMNIKF